MAPDTKPWSVWLTDHVNRDGRTRYLVVQPSDGGHVTEADAEWLRGLLRGANAPRHEVSLMAVPTPGDSNNWVIAVCSCGRWSSNKTLNPGQAAKSAFAHVRSKEGRRVF